MHPVVVRNRLHVSRSQRSDAAIDEMPSRFRHSSHDFEFVGGEGEDLELAQIPRERVLVFR